MYTGNKIVATTLAAFLFTSNQIVQGQISFDGCSSFENARANLLLRSAITCLDVPVTEALYFKNSIVGSDMNAIKNCFDDPVNNIDDCNYVIEWLGSESATEGTVPHAFTDSILQDPVGTCSCLALLPESPNAKSLTPQCDAYQIVTGLEALSGVCAQATVADEWLNSEWVEGCNSADLVNLGLSVLPMSDCLGLEASDLNKLSDLETDILNEVKSCVYDPVDGNSDCHTLLDTIEEKEQAPDSVMTRVLNNIVTEPDEFCDCTIGLGYNEHALAVRDQCKMKEIVKYAQGADDLCAMVKVNEQVINDELSGCSESDIVRSTLTGVNLLNCLGIDPKKGDAVISTLNGIDVEKLEKISDCFQIETTTSMTCKNQLKDLAREAAMAGDVITATLATELLEDPSRICTCVTSSTETQLWTDMSPSCKPDSIHDMVESVDETCYYIQNKIEPGEVVTVFNTGVALDLQQIRLEAQLAADARQEQERLAAEALEMEFMYAREIEEDTCIGFLVNKCSEADDVNDCAYRMFEFQEISKQCLNFIQVMLNPVAQDCAISADAACPHDIFTEYGSKASTTHYKCVTKTLRSDNMKYCKSALKPAKADTHCLMEVVSKCGVYKKFDDHMACIEKNMLKFSCSCRDLFVGSKDQCASSSPTVIEEKAASSSADEERIGRNGASGEN